MLYQQKAALWPSPLFPCRLHVHSDLAVVLQLLSSSRAQGEAQVTAASQMIQGYGEALTGKDARLALEYYWQAAAVVGGSSSVKVSTASFAAAITSFVCATHHTGES